MRDNRYIIFDIKWFENNQVILLTLLNHNILKYLFRPLLNIQNDLKYSELVYKIQPNNIKVLINSNTVRAVFHTSDVFSKLIYFKFKLFWNILHFWDINFANKFIPKLNLGYDTLTVYPDADPESTSVDGQVARIVSSPGEAFTTITVGAGNSQSTTNSLIRIKLYTGGITIPGNFSILRRGATLFDTSSLTSSATITAATYGIYCNTIHTGQGSNYEIDLVKIYTSSNTSLSNSDYYYSNWFTTVFCSWAYSELSTSAYVTKSLNSSGLTNISKTGISKFGLRLDWDTNNSFTGTWASDDTTGSGPEIRSADYSGTYGPKLTVTYTLPYNIVMMI